MDPMNRNPTSLPTVTLIGSIFIPRALWQEALLILGGSLLVGLMAQVAIPLPFTPVPVTGQTFAVLLVGALYGSQRGALTVGLYLLEGALGLPVFAGGTSGLGRLLGPTGGYLIGFVAAAWIVGRLCEHGWDRRVPTAALAMLMGNAVIYLCGLPWLALFVGPERSLMAGLWPFIPGDLIKLVLAAVALPAGWRLIRLRASLER
jgi:biotin transport system substrate-specific component